MLSSFSRPQACCMRGFEGIEKLELVLAAPCATQGMLLKLINNSSSLIKIVSGYLILISIHFYDFISLFSP